SVGVCLPHSSGTPIGRRATRAPQRGHRKVTAITRGASDSSYSSTSIAATRQSRQWGGRVASTTNARTTAVAARMAPSQSASLTRGRPRQGGPNPRAILPPPLPSGPCIAWKGGSGGGRCYETADRLSADGHVLAVPQLYWAKAVTPSPARREIVAAPRSL